MTNPTSNPPPSPSELPDELAAGRAEFLRLAAAVASKNNDAVAQVLAELSVFHPAAWQLCLQAAAWEHIAALHHIAGGDAQRAATPEQRSKAVHLHLQSKAFKALDHAEAVADRRGD